MFDKIYFLLKYEIMNLNAPFDVQTTDVHRIILAKSSMKNIVYWENTASALTFQNRPHTLTT